jgi:hypothetical protein
VFFHINDGGIAPRPEYFLADYDKDYLPEPAVKSVRINVENYYDFINEFDLHTQDKLKKLGYEPCITLSDTNQIYLVNYRAYESEGRTTADFDLVANRAFLRRVNRWLVKMTNK